uniref:Uncharacterized protein n=1 Tax=Anopheles atroparvus TaxID=41427 RepID=A0A182IWM3_ANOAO
MLVSFSRLSSALLVFFLASFAAAAALLFALRNSLLPARFPPFSRLRAASAFLLSFFEDEDCAAAVAVTAAGVVVVIAGAPSKPPPLLLSQCIDEPADDVIMPAPLIPPTGDVRPKATAAAEVGSTIVPPGGAGTPPIEPPNIATVDDGTLLPLVEPTAPSDVVPLLVADETLSDFLREPPTPPPDLDFFEPFGVAGDAPGGGACPRPPRAPLLCICGGVGGSAFVLDTASPPTGAVAAKGIEEAPVPPADATVDDDGTLLSPETTPAALVSLARFSCATGTGIVVGPAVPPVDAANAAIVGWFAVAPTTTEAADADGGAGDGGGGSASVVAPLLLAGPLECADAP